MVESGTTEEKGALEAGEGEAAPDLEALYNEGMAYYRRRRWREAKECFTRLNELQPSRRVEALLHELDIFLQLELVEAETAEDAIPAAAAVEARPEEEYEQAPPAGQRAWIPWVVVGIVLALIGGGLFLALTGRLPFVSLVSRDQRIKNLRNLGEAYMVAQQYCKALKTYAELLPLLPEDPEVINGVEKAKAKLYEEAQAYLKANNREQALGNLRCILERDSGYKDVAELIQSLERRQTLEAEYGRAHEYLVSNACREAVDRLEKLRATDPEYSPGTISDALYEAYMCLGRQLMELVASELKLAPTAQPTEPSWAVTQGILDNALAASRAFGKALNERPTSEEAKLNKDLADKLKQGLERYSVAAWAECLPPLMAIYDRDAGYLSGKVAALLCDARLHLGDLYARKGDYRAALKEYQALLEMKGCDPQPAQTRAREVGVYLTPSPTPTLTPTFTATPTATATHTPKPTATATPRPTATPTPTPTPTTPSGGGRTAPPPPTEPPPVRS